MFENGFDFNGNGELDLGDLYLEMEIVDDEDDDDDDDEYGDDDEDVFSI